MGEVADALGLSRAGVTSTVDRLVADGLVLRERGGGDKRLLHARLTPAGRERVEEAARTHDDLSPTCSPCSGTTPPWSPTPSPGCRPRPPRAEHDAARRHGTNASSP